MEQEGIRIKPQYRYAGICDLDYLVQMRIRDLVMFSDRVPDETTVENIRRFYRESTMNGQCCTLLGSHEEHVIATATIYFYHILPSNENPSGRVGQITNVWVEDSFRRQGIATEMVGMLLEKARGEAGMVCLNSSRAALSLYRAMGFKNRDNYLVYDFETGK